MKKFKTVNNIFNFLWSKINAKLNGALILDPGDKRYAYKAYFENHLGYSIFYEEFNLLIKSLFVL